MFKGLCLSLCFSLSCASAWAGTFSTDYCEFSVTFPADYSTREMIYGQSGGIAAVANATRDTRIAAECWPYTDQSPINIYAKAMQAEMEQRGFAINSVSIDRNNKLAPQIVISGRLEAGGETYYTTTISIMGKSSRLDLSIVERHLASKAHMTFRESVRWK